MVTCGRVMPTFCWVASKNNDKQVLCYARIQAVSGNGISIKSPQKLKEPFQPPFIMG
jgi:hypothetical protein